VVSIELVSWIVEIVLRGKMQDAMRRLNGYKVDGEDLLVVSRGNRALFLLSFIIHCSTK
jgi:hypothetical protein